MATEYGDSVEFTNDMEEMQRHLLKAQEILQKPEFAQWMQATETHYCDQFVMPHQALLMVVNEAKERADQLVESIFTCDE